MSKTGLLDPKIIAALDAYNRKVANWRFGKRKLKRELGRDRPPNLVLKQGLTAAEAVQ